MQIHGPALRLVRTLRGLSQADVATAAGVDESYVAHIEAGRRRGLVPAAHAAMLDALDIEELPQCGPPAPTEDLAAWSARLAAELRGPRCAT